MKPSNFYFDLSVCFRMVTLNLYHAEFLKWNNPSSIFGTIHYHFRDIKMKTCSWSANSIEPGQTTDVHSGLALYWWQRHITFGVGRIRVKCLKWYYSLHKTIHCNISSYKLLKNLCQRTSLLKDYSLLSWSSVSKICNKNYLFKKSFVFFICKAIIWKFVFFTRRSTCNFIQIIYDCVKARKSYRSLT